MEFDHLIHEMLTTLDRGPQHVFAGLERRVHGEPGSPCASLFVHRIEIGQCCHDFSIAKSQPHLRLGHQITTQIGAVDIESVVRLHALPNLPGENELNGQWCIIQHPVADAHLIDGSGETGVVAEIVSDAQGFGTWRDLSTALQLQAASRAAIEMKRHTAGGIISECHMLPDIGGDLDWR